jgi:ATP-dependent DNA helicase RecQ
MSHIIDVLRGSKSQKVLQNGHDQLSTHGIGKDKSLDDWRLLGRSLLHQGLVAQTTDGYSVLKLNALSWEVMRRQRSVAIAVPPKPVGAIHESLSPQDREWVKGSEVEMLFERLRRLRKQLADEQSVPPYVVFADSTLKLMAQAQPQTLVEFGQLSGVGSHKLAQYGERFLAEIRAYCQEQGLLGKKDTATPTHAVPSETQLFTLQLYQQGLSVEEIAQKRDIRPTTIIRHLSDLVEMNQPVDLNRLVSPQRQEKIWQALQKIGDNSLTPIREHLGESYSFDEIRLVRGQWRRDRRD